eukprot:TRINITY_DN2422_c0_g2_i1.p1 TRINITY_DN2422_c0_g2~~TRINITY_DN2422_c0_g2_i1.p1  ORF type:complete len:506 (+),score=166.44 TRINITY_DN2422_c0_g2_i1:59-1576(+)
MKLTRIILFICVFTIIFGETSENVKTITPNDWEDTLKSYDYSIIKYFTPWCGHCNELEPEFAEAAEAMNKLSSKILFGGINCQEYPEFCSKHGIEGFPTIKIFKKDKFISDYLEDRKSKDIYEYMILFTSKFIEEIDSEEKRKEFIKNEYYVIYSGEVSEGIKEFFENLAIEFLNAISFGFDILTSEKKLVVKHPNSDEAIMYFTEKTSEEELKTFFDLNRKELVAVLNRNNFRDYFYQNAPSICLYFFNPKEDSFVNYVTSVKTLLSEKNVFENGTLPNFVAVDGIRFSSFLERLGLVEIPSLSCIDFKNNRNFNFLDFSSEIENLTQFLKDFLEGNAKPFVKSAKAPEDPWSDDGVLVIVGNSWIDLLQMEYLEHDRLVVVHAPWCGHCKALLPTFYKVAQMLKTDAFKKAFMNENDKEIIFATLDGDSNDIPNSNVVVQGFPTILMFKAGEKKPIVFEGARNQLEILEFVLSNGSLEYSKTFDNLKFNKVMKELLSQDDHDL